MIRLTTRKKMRVSNRLAFFAALTLVISALAGMSNSQLTGQGAEGSMAAHAANRISQAAATSPGTGTVQGNKGFKMSLFLIRGN